MFVYLDNSATTRAYDEVTKVVAEAMSENFGNPSSLHRLGMDAEKIVKEAKKQVADSLGAKTEEIFFTSGGTESDNTAIFGAVNAKKRMGNKIITSEIEHPAVLEAFKELKRRGFEVALIPVDQQGYLELDAMKREIDENTILISVMHVNNEVGTLQPLSEIAALRDQANQKWNKGILFHTDAVQSYGKEKINLKEFPVDLLSLSAHKIHGPKGIGALYIREGVRISPFVFGGGQERGFRSGTENVPGIAGLGKAAELSMRKKTEEMERMREVRNYLLDGILKNISEVKLNSIRDGEVSAAILNVSFPGCRGEVLLHMLEQKEIYVSTGSACASHKKGSHVLTAMGLSEEEIEGALRFSFNRENTKEQMDYVIAELKTAVESMRRLKNMMGRGRK